MNNENSAVPSPTKDYSIRQTYKFLNWYSNYEYLKRLIHKDIENNYNETYKVRVIRRKNLKIDAKRKEKYYYFINGATILDIINKHNAEIKTDICVEQLQRVNNKLTIS